MAKIVAVDDDPAGQRLIKYMLSAAGHEVITAPNGIQGLKIVNQESPDMVILDVMLPGLDGFEVCRRLRTGASTKNIPVIMVSGKTQESDRDTALKMGANEYLVKPVERQQLLNTVSALLSETEETPVSRAKVIGLIGARGGAGTSTVSINLAVALQKLNKQTILVDMNPSYGSLAEMVGMKTERSIAWLFKSISKTVNVEALNDLFEEHDSGMKLLWGETYPDEAESYDAENVKTLFSEITAMADYVVVDIPAAPTDNAITALTLADSVMLITGAGKEALGRLENPVSHLVRFGVDAGMIQVIIVDKTGVAEIDDVIGEVVDGEYKLAGVLHFCGNDCAEAEAQGKPVIVSAPNSRISEDIQRLAKEIVETA